MEELMTLNIFAYSPLAPLIGVLLFGGLLALPLYYDGSVRPAAPTTCCPDVAERTIAGNDEATCGREAARAGPRCDSTTSR